MSRNQQVALSIVIVSFLVVALISAACEPRPPGGNYQLPKPTATPTNYSVKQAHWLSGSTNNGFYVFRDEAKNTDCYAVLFNGASIVCFRDGVEQAAQ